MVKRNADVLLLHKQGLSLSEIVERIARVHKTRRVTRQRVHAIIKREEQREIEDGLKEIFDVE